MVGAVIMALLSGCTEVSPLGTSATPSTTSIPTPDRLSDLRRPLVATPLASDGSCPVDHGVYAAEFPGAQGFVAGIRVGYVAYGPGPVAPAFVATPEAAELSFTKMPQRDGRAFEKIIWIVAPSTIGPILVRAIAADGATATFMRGSDLELPGPGTHPEGLVYFPTPGCYTFQADHSRGTHRVTVLVRP